jgi:hypothetical protein
MDIKARDVPIFSHEEEEKSGGIGGKARFNCPRLRTGAPLTR